MRDNKAEIDKEIYAGGKMISLMFGEKAVDA